MEYLCAELNDLPDEILMIILEKMNNFDVLYSLLGINQRLDRIIRSSIFTSRLTFARRLSPKFIDLIESDTMLHRFCLQILPEIHDKIEWLDLVSSSMKDILYAVDYPNLKTLGLHNIDEKSIRHFFTDETLTSCIFKNQITTLFLTMDNNGDSFDDVGLSIAKICDYIFTIFTCLTDLTICESPYRNYVGLAFDKPSLLSNFHSSTLRKLNVHVQLLDDCLYLLDGRFNQLHTLYIDVDDISRPIDIQNQDDLPNLKCFSLSCHSETSYYDELVLPLLYRMSNLEELDLYLPVIVYETFIDGNHFKKTIINCMPRLNQFRFYIRSRMFAPNRMNLPSAEDIRQTFIGFPNDKIISYTDYLLERREIHCHIYSYPSLMTYYSYITNNYPGGLFQYVRAVSLFDERPFEREFFLRIQKSFPVMERLSLANRKSQNYKEFYELNANNLKLSPIEYPLLNDLYLGRVHDDYIEQFLFDTKTNLQNNVRLYIDYEALQRVTHNFTRDATRINCTKIHELIFLGKECSNSSFLEYFPHGRILYPPGF